MYGFEAAGYWLDIGTPDRYLQATFEILEGDVQTEIGRRVAAAGGVLLEGDAAGVTGTIHGPALCGSGCVVAATAIVCVPGRLG